MQFIVDVVKLAWALVAPEAETVAVPAILAVPGTAWKVKITIGSLPAGRGPDSVQVRLVIVQVPAAPRRTIDSTVTEEKGSPAIAIDTPLIGVLPLLPNLTIALTFVNPGTLDGISTWVINKPVAPPELTVAVSIAVAGVETPPPEMTAVLVTLAGAFVAITTSMVMLG